MTSTAQRLEIIEMIDEAVANGTGRTRACEVVGISPSTLRRWRPVGGESVSKDGRPGAVRPVPTNRYSDTDRELIVATCNSPEFASLPPSQIVPTLADQQIYIGSESTLYRVLKENGQLNHRGRASERTSKSQPTTHVATAINQVWMMDVTWLPSRVRGQFFYLYMVEDLYSRFGIYWEVFEAENSENTVSVIEKAMWREKCLLDPPVLHHDNGSPLISQTVHQKVLSMGITPSRSRPRVSNDNAYIESFFRTLKYCPMWPSQGFETVTDAREWVENYMQWYNHEHKHSALKFVTPAQRHRGEDKAILAARDEFYRTTQQAHPERWSGDTRNWKHKPSMTLNPTREPVQSEDTFEVKSTSEG